MTKKSEKARFRCNGPVMKLDREFFRSHPDEEEYRRLSIPGEFPMRIPPRVYVRVINHGGGMRTRYLCQAKSK